MGKLISSKKKHYMVNKELRKYLKHNGRLVSFDLDYYELLRYTNSVPLKDAEGKFTCWLSVCYKSWEQREINESLLEIYALLKANGDCTLLNHLEVDRIDLCLFGNSQPFRIRIINTLNDNYDYFYIKKADASRIYGLELEHILSPNRIGFFLNQDTLVVEHIYGIPGDIFIENFMDKRLNEVRLAKEFVKFNERCFLRLLGDMHASNFVVDISMDVEDCNYRIRAIDFDQQSYEGRMKVYLPQFYLENNPIVNVGLKNLNHQTARQYQIEERMLIVKRIKSSRQRLQKLLQIMEKDLIAPLEHVFQIRSELSDHYQNNLFSRCTTMGQLVKTSLESIAH